MRAGMNFNWNAERYKHIDTFQVAYVELFTSCHRRFPWVGAHKRASNARTLKGILTVARNAGPEDFQQLRQASAIQNKEKNTLAHTLVLLDGQHGQSVDNFIGGEWSAQGTAKDVLENTTFMQRRRWGRTKMLNGINFAGCLCHNHETVSLKLSLFQRLNA